MLPGVLTNLVFLPGRWVRLAPLRLLSQPQLLYPHHSRLVALPAALPASVTDQALPLRLQRASLPANRHRWQIPCCWEGSPGGLIVNRFVPIADRRLVLLVLPLKAHPRCDQENYPQFL